MLNFDSIKFADEYLIDTDEVAAAIRCGISRKKAKDYGKRMLADTGTVLYIQHLMDKRSRDVGVKAVDVISEIRKMAFSDITDYVNWDGDGNVKVISSGQLTKDQTAAICEVTNTAFGVKVKLYDKKSNLELLAKHLQLLGVGVDGVDDEPLRPVQINIIAHDCSEIKL